MNTFYDIVKVIKDELHSSPFVNTVTYGEIGDVDLNQTTVYPLSHFITDNVQVGEKVLLYSISVMSMDVIAEDSDEENPLGFSGNEEDIYNTQLNVLTKLIQVLKKGSLARTGYKLENEPTVSPFKDRFKDVVAGWETTLTIKIINGMPVC
tara:strand:+ start:80 stop:532 length:453 start_codon:yes stop_codon:yes gene_type:complete